MDPTGPYAQLYLAGFCASTVAAISIMGGTFAVLPAYEAGNTTLFIFKYNNPLNTGWVWILNGKKSSYRKN